MSASTDASFSRRQPLWWAKQIVRAVVLVLVLWGIWRTALRARDDLARQQADVRRRLAELDEQLRRLATARHDDPRREELQRARRHLQAQRIDWREVGLPWLAASMCCYLAGTMPSWWFWHRTLRALGQRPDWRHSLRAYTIGHLGKYVPGKALVVVLRASLVRGTAVATWAAVAAVFVETLTLMAVGAALGGLLLVLTRGRQVPPFWCALAGALALGAGLPTYPPLFRWLVRKLQRRSASSELDQALKGLDGSLMVHGWLVTLVAWFFLGLSLWAVIRSLPGDHRPWAASLADLPLLTAVVSLAMVLGFASLIPGGFGVRELVVTSLLAPHPALGVARALGAAVLLRLVWLLSELVLSSILFLGLRGPVAEAPDSQRNRRDTTPSST